MIEIAISDIINQKVLPFDLYDEDTTKIFTAGEIMTPGKVLVLRNYEKLFKRKDEDAFLPFNAQRAIQELKEEFALEEELQNAPKSFLDAEPINKISKFEPVFQKEIKQNYLNFSKVLKEDDYKTAREHVLELRDCLVENVLDAENNARYCSELKLLSDHFDCHSLNTAIYAICLANKMDYNPKSISEVALAALLHDIGKINLPKKYNPNNPQITKKQLLLYQAHTIHGYKIIKHKFKLPREIARVALEHHETMDGNGWPYGISNDMISEYAQIVSVANCFDNLSSELNGGDPVKFSSAMRELLKKGSKVFSPRALYTFVHMFYYSDNVSLKDLMS